MLGDQCLTDLIEGLASFHMHQINMFDYPLADLWTFYLISLKFEHFVAWHRSSEKFKIFSQWGIHFYSD